MADGADTITQGHGEDRIAIAGQDLHAGEPIELLIDGVWRSARAEWAPGLGWYAMVPRDAYGGWCGLLRPGVRARRG